MLGCNAAAVALHLWRWEMTIGTILSLANTMNGSLSVSGVSKGDHFFQPASHSTAAHQEERDYAAFIDKVEQQRTDSTTHKD